MRALVVSILVVIICSSCQSEYDSKIPFRKGLFYAYKRNNVGIVKQDDSILIPIIFDHIYLWEDSSSLYVKDNSGVGLYDNKGNVLIPTAAGYTSIVKTRVTDLYIAMTEESCFLVNNKNHILSERFNGKIFEDITSAGHTLFLVNCYGTCSSPASKSGFIDSTGQVIIPFVLDDAHLFCGSDLAPVCYKGKWGYIDEKGNEMIPFQFDDALSFPSKNNCNDIAAVENKGKWGFINRKGALTIPYIYDDVKSDSFSRITKVRQKTKISSVLNTRK